MKRKVKIYLYLLVVLGASTWMLFIANERQQSLTFDEQLALGDEYFEDEIYLDAVFCYQAALEVNPESFDAWLKLAESYKFLGEEEEFIACCETAIEVDPSSDKPYILMAEYFVGVGEVEEAIRVLESADEVEDKTKINEMLDSLLYMFEPTYQMYESISTWHNGYAVVEKNGLFGLVSEELEVVVQPIYQSVGMYDPETGLIPVEHNNEWFYIDSDGYKRMSAPEGTTFLGPFSDGVAPIAIGEDWYVMDVDGNLSGNKYGYIGSFYNGVAAAQNDEGKWVLINKEAEPVSKEFDSIVIDDHGFCSKAGVVFVENNGKFQLVDLEGNAVSDMEFDEVSSFQLDEPAAVKVDDKWGFVSSKGEIIIEPQFEDAMSFSNGLAAVKQDGKWGYINSEGEFKIPPQFEGAMPFSEAGTAPVKNGYYWELIKVYST